MLHHPFRDVGGIKPWEIFKEAFTYCQLNYNEDYDVPELPDSGLRSLMTSLKMNRTSLTMGFDRLG